MAYVKTIEKLYDRACLIRRASLSRSGNEVYKITKMDGATTLLHYGTKTLEVEYGEIRHLYGLSRSDVDSINTLLHNLNIHSFHVGFKPVNGGFYAWIPSLRKEIFLDDYDTRGSFARDIQANLDQSSPEIKPAVKIHSQPMPVL